MSMARDMISTESRICLLYTSDVYKRQGAGYVGLSLATLLGQKHEVIVLDIDEEKVAKVNSRISPVQDVDVYKRQLWSRRPGVPCDPGKP